VSPAPLVDEHDKVGPHERLLRASWARVEPSAHGGGHNAPSGSSEATMTGLNNPLQGGPNYSFGDRCVRPWTT
jgi:hypothetical protein